MDKKGRSFHEALLAQPAEVAEGVRNAFGSLVRTGLLFDRFRKLTLPLRH